MYELCPACNAPESTEFMVSIHRCVNCGALYGETTLEASYFLVRPEWATGPEAPVSEWQHYDFICQMPDGSQIRRHGWADPISRKILQTG